MASKVENYRTLETLKAQLEFIEKGGYRIPDNALWRPPSMFLDSPTCLNFRAPHGTHPCDACMLMRFVPLERRRAVIPCHHIPLTEAGDTVASAEGWADQSELEGLVKAWLRTAIAQLERAIHRSAGEQQAKRFSETTDEVRAMLTGKLRLATVRGEARQFVAESGSGHALVIDTKDGNTGPTPVELVVLAAGGCTAFDIIGILRKKRQQVTGYEVIVSAEQQEAYPRVFTKLKIHHILRGEIEPEAVERAIHLSETKYCSVGAMLARSASIETTYEIILERLPETAPQAVG